MRTSIPTDDRLVEATTLRTRLNLIFKRPPHDTATVAGGRLAIDPARSYGVNGVRVNRISQRYPSSYSNATEHSLLWRRRKTLVEFRKVITRQRCLFCTCQEKSQDEVDSCNFQSTTKHFTVAKSTGEKISQYHEFHC